MQDDEVVDYYTVSVNSHPASNVSFSVVSSEAFAALNSMYTVSVTATNCAGTSEASRLEIGREATSKWRHALMKQSSGEGGEFEWIPPSASLVTLVTIIL